MLYSNQGYWKRVLVEEGNMFDLAKAGVSQNIAGLFLETHPDPDKAKCDGPCALKLSELDAFLEKYLH